MVASTYRTTNSRSNVDPSPAWVWAAAFRKARLKQGITQAALAQAIGKSEPTIRNWESGKRVPRVFPREIDLIASALGIKPETCRQWFE